MASIVTDSGNPVPLQQ